MRRPPYEVRRRAALAELGGCLRELVSPDEATSDAALAKILTKLVALHADDRPVFERVAYLIQLGASQRAESVVGQVHA